MRELIRRLEVLFNRKRFDADLDEELRDHLRRKALDTGDAAAARSQFGNVTLIQEESRNMWTWNWLEQLGQDIRYAFRAMASNKLFTAMAVASLALGIGANTAIYSFMDAVMLRALPVRHPEGLVILNWRSKGEAPVVHDHWGSDYDEPGGGTTSPNYPYPAYELLKTRSDALETLFGFAGAGRLNVVVDGQAELADGEFVTGGYFEGLGVPPVAGRAIGPDDDRAGAPPVAMITFDYWRARFASSAAVVGKAVQLNGKPFTIVGVAAPEFYGVSPQVRPGVFIPMADIGVIRVGDWAANLHNGTFYFIELMGRLNPGVTLAMAEARLAGPFRNFVLSTATNDRERADLPTLWLQEGGSGVDALRRQYSKPLWILMTMAGLILMIACANIANLLLARASSRRREMAVRLSLGAGRLRIVRQLLTESVLLAMIGAAAGVGVAALWIRILAVLFASDDGLTLRVGIDWRVLGFTLAVALATGILFGLAPALAATRVDTTGALKEARSSAAKTGRAHLGGLPFGLSHVLVTAQIALSLLLVAGAALFVKTLGNLHAVNLGFNAENVLTFLVDPGKAGYEGTALTRFYSGVEERLRTIPGVRAATSTNVPLVADWSDGTSIEVPGIPKPAEGERGPNTKYAFVGPTFFETMEIPIVAGRALNSRDVEGAQAVVVVNPVFVEKYCKGQNPIGRHFKFGGSSNAFEVEIVGVARAARYNSLKREIPPVTYLPWLQTGKARPMRDMTFAVRTAADPLEMANAVRKIVGDVSRLVPVQGMMTQQHRIDQTISRERTFAKLCSWFGGLALLMACVGLYGTMAYAVARRTSEIGIRMALGAERARIVWMVLREVIVLAALGVAIGFAAVYESVEFVKTMLFGMQPGDPWALGLSASVLIGCALLAGFLPALRASRIDPMVALRHE